MTDVQAALGIHQLARLEDDLRRRTEIWSSYDGALSELPVERPAPIGEDMVHSRHLYSILIDEGELGKTRDQVLDELLALGIGTGVHFTAVHLHPFYRQAFGHREGEFPVAEDIGARTVSLPMSGALGDEEVEDVIAAVHQVAGVGAGAGAA
jgi:dTDP-4-amino-4,6-dideoxygalactose transaminase